MDITIKGKPLVSCTDDDLVTEWQAGMWFEAQQGLTPQQLERVQSIEAEMKRREDAGTWNPSDDL